MADATISVFPVFSVAATSITGLTASRIVYGGSSGAPAQSANLVFDATNRRFGLNISSPTFVMHVRNVAESIAYTFSEDGGVGLTDSTYGSRFFVYDNGSKAIEFKLQSSSLGRITMTGVDFEFHDGTNQLVQIHRTLADTETSLSVRRDVGGTETVQRVTMGAADSGGAGFKVLRVPN